MIQIKVFVKDGVLSKKLQVFDGFNPQKLASWWIRFKFSYIDYIEDKDGVYMIELTESDSLYEVSYVSVYNEVDLEDILNAVCEVWRVPKEELINNKTRFEQFVVPRFAFYAVGRILTGSSFQALGDTFNQDHATVIHACRVGIHQKIRPSVSGSIQDKIMLLGRKLGYNNLLNEIKKLEK
jgi:hypothetical protein